MSFQIQRDTIFVDMKLTSLGRQLASLGRLRYKKAVLSDDEIDYSFETPFYDLTNNFISSPSDASPSIAPVNFDGTPAIQLGPKNLIRGKENEESEMFDQPFFMSAGTRNALDVSKCISIGSCTTLDLNGGNDLVIGDITSIDPQFSGTAIERCVGNLVLVRHHAPTSFALDHFGEQPFISLWYRIESWDGGTNFKLDRALPNFASGSGNTLWFVYPWSGFSSGGTSITSTTSGSLYVFSAEYTGPMIDSGIVGPYGYGVYSNDGQAGIDTGMYYNVDHWDFYVAGDLKYASAPGDYSTPLEASSWSGVSGADPTPTFAGYGGESNIWNMRIIRTINEIGSTGATTGYTTYGSTTFNGTRRIFGFDSNQKAVGIIYYDNPQIDIDETNRLQLSSTTLFAPTLLWHRKPEFTSGNGTKGGHKFTDKKSKLYFDPIAQLSYSKLMDGTDPQAIEVGRIYHDLRMLVITDPEMLNAMSYKSNRNWTLPPLNVSLQKNYIPNTTGLCLSDKTYLVTYVMSTDSAYSTGSSLSYRKYIHCGYIAQVDGMDGGPYTLVARFSNSYFPYMRTSSGIASFSGTGWNANDFNILVKEMDKTEFSGIGSVSSSGWKFLTSGGEYSNQHSENTISPSGLTSYQFTINRDNYTAATDYSLSSINGDSFDRTFSGLSYGDETFFFGNLDYDINKDPEKMSIRFDLMPHQYNTTNNSTYGSNNECTYITSIHILDDLDRVVAIAKPSRPIKKGYSRYIEFQLDLIYE